MDGYRKTHTSDEPLQPNQLRYYYQNIFVVDFLDAEPLLRVLSVQVDRIHGHHILCVPQEKVTDHLAAFVPSLVDAARSLDSGQIYRRYVVCICLCVVFV